MDRPKLPVIPFYFQWEVFGHLRCKRESLASSLRASYTTNKKNNSDKASVFFKRLMDVFALFLCTKSEGISLRSLMKLREPWRKQMHLVKSYFIKNADLLHQSLGAYNFRAQRELRIPLVHPTMNLWTTKHMLRGQKCPACCHTDNLPCCWHWTQTF